MSRRTQHYGHYKSHPRVKWKTVGIVERDSSEAFPRWNIDARDIGFGRGFKEYQAAAQSLHIPLESLPIRASNVDFVAAFNVGAQARNRFVFRYIEPRFHVRGMLGTAGMAE